MKLAGKIVRGFYCLEKPFEKVMTFSASYISSVIELRIPLQEAARPLHCGDEMPLYVLSIQETAELLASQLEAKPAGAQVKFP